MRAVGLENRKECGRIKKVRRDDLIDSARPRRPEAFSMMELARSVDGLGTAGLAPYRSMEETTGATSDAAQAALTASAPRRWPSLSVFHFLSSGTADGVLELS